MRSGFLFLLVLTLHISVSTFAYDWSTNPGDGSVGSPYEISEPNHLMAIGSEPTLLDKHFILTKDIAFDPNNNPAHVFEETLIAPYNGSANHFNGTFNAHRFAIRNLTIQRSDRSSLGLFGTIGSTGEVSNLTLANAVINGHYNTAALAYQNGGLIENCHVYATVTGKRTVGLITSYNTHIITSCSAHGSVTAFHEIEVGAIAGNNEGVINDCFSDAIVNGYGSTGGIAGTNGAQIQNCIFSGTVNMTGGSGAGGIAGKNSYAVINNCSVIGPVNAVGGGSMCGGIAGTNGHSSIERSSIRNNVQGHSFVGGITGDQLGDSVLQNCYIIGSVTADSSIYIGGIIGSQSGGLVNNCYATGPVNAPVSSNPYSGGIVGYFSQGNISNCYFLDTAGPDNGFGTPLDDPNMMIQANFADWDFLGESTNGHNDIWRMCIDDVDYPRLSSEFSKNGDFACEDGVDIFDLQALAEHWLLTEITNPTVFSYACDANGDGVIDMADYSVLGENW